MDSTQLPQPVTVPSDGATDPYQDYPGSPTKVYTDAYFEGHDTPPVQQRGITTGRGFINPDPYPVTHGITPQRAILASKPANYYRPADAGRTKGVSGLFALGGRPGRGVAGIFDNLDFSNIATDPLGTIEQNAIGIIYSGNATPGAAGATPGAVIATGASPGNPTGSANTSGAAANASGTRVLLLLGAAAFFLLSKR